MNQCRPRSPKRGDTMKWWSAALAGILLCVPAAAREAVDVLERSGVKGGLIVHLGCSDGELTARLRAGEQGLDTSEAAVAAARRRLRSQGVYGPVSVDLWDGKHLPYADNLVNLIVADASPGASEHEVVRVLAPRGVLLVRREGQWRKTIKPWPEEIDEWTHYFHGSDGNPVAQDTAVGPPERLQW
ncbi:MAG: methyltransferase domain-containing protein, partial [Planctomycetota bacterium]